MREDDKPFVLYRRGPGNFTIVPGGVRGWVQFGMWMAMLLPMLAALIVWSMAHPEGPRHWIGVATFLLGTAAWSLGGILWMRARAEVVDVAAVLREKRRQDRVK